MGLESELATAGYKVLGSTEIEKLILKILKNDNPRYWKAIPLLIYLHNPNVKQIHQTTKQKKRFGEIIGITRRIFLEKGIAKALAEIDEKTDLDFEEYLGEFNLQLSRQGPLLVDKEKINAERHLQMNLSRIFAKKERHIIRRIINGQPISKTDAEYFSRKTKKKLQAIIHLHEFAASLIPLTLNVDQELFELKRLLEDFGKFTDLYSFMTSTTAIRVDGFDGKQRMTKMIHKIPGKRAQELLKIYPNHDFGV